MTTIIVYHYKSKNYNITITCIFIWRNPAKINATVARNIPAHIRLSGFGLRSNGYITVSNSGIRIMMKRGLNACIWSGFMVPKKPVSRSKSLWSLLLSLKNYQV